MKASWDSFENMVRKKNAKLFRNHPKNNFENGIKPKTKIEGSFKG
jgi:hypothetical protein